LYNVQLLKVNIAACFSKKFTAFHNTMCELIQGNTVKVEMHEGDMSSPLTR